MFENTCTTFPFITLVLELCTASLSFLGELTGVVDVTACCVITSSGTSIVTQLITLVFLVVQNVSSPVFWWSKMFHHLFF